jgi:hypothetical protein
MDNKIKIHLFMEIQPILTLCDFASEMQQGKTTKK